MSAAQSTSGELAPQSLIISFSDAFAAAPEMGRVIMREMRGSGMIPPMPISVSSEDIPSQIPQAVISFTEMQSISMGAISPFTADIPADIPSA